MKHDVILKAFGTLCVQCVLSDQLFFSACGMLMLLSIMGHSCMDEAWPGRVVLTGAFTAETDPIPCLQPCPFSLSSSRSATGLRPSAVAQCLTDSAQEFRSFLTRPPSWDSQTRPEVRNTSLKPSGPATAPSLRGKYGNHGTNQGQANLILAALHYGFISSH